MSSVAEQHRVPQFESMIRGILTWNALLTVIAVVALLLFTRDYILVVGVLFGAGLATVNAVLLARKLRAVTSLPDPSSGQISMMLGMVIRFIVMGAGMALFVIVFQPDLMGILGMVGAILLFQVVAGWQASRTMSPSLEAEQSV